MEIQLQALIDQIKRDGVDAAVTEAEAVLNAAKAEAEKIISDAKAEAEKYLINAKNENDKMVKSSEDAIRQAGRNLLITFRESVSKELNAIVGENVTAVYSSEAFAQLIIKAVEGWTAKPDAEDISVILNSEDLKALEDTLLAGLKEKMIKGVTLKANDNFDGGFRIAENNGGAYYDYSAQAVVDMLSNYLSPKVTALLKEAE
ncbi:MAG: hypothetical protein IKB62_04475 [Oscillospiraceae bacterium]|nr:hypothetical protein [Oscillospiraceae bacterium]